MSLLLPTSRIVIVLVKNFALTRLSFVFTAVSSIEILCPERPI
jgi:hypothetical protein